MGVQTNPDLRHTYYVVLCMERMSSTQAREAAEIFERAGRREDAELARDVAKFFESQGK